MSGQLNIGDSNLKRKCLIVLQKKKRKRPVPERISLKHEPIKI